MSSVLLFKSTKVSYNMVVRFFKLAIVAEPMRKMKKIFHVDWGGHPVHPSVFLTEARVVALFSEKLKASSFVSWSKFFLGFLLTYSSGESGGVL